MIISEEDYLAHYGILRKSGRYPWGSGEDQNTRNRSFLDTVGALRKDGMSEVDIARGFGITTSELRAAKSIAKNETKQADIGMAQRLKAKGMSNIAIGERMGINESSVRALLAPGQQEKADNLQVVASMLKDHVDQKGFIDVGTGVEQHIGVSETKLKTALAVLKEQGYVVERVQIDQLGTNNKTTIKVLAPPGTTYRDIVANKDQIKGITDYSEDGGRSFLGIQPPLNVSSKRVAIRYEEQGGKDADGVIYVRPGVDDISLGKARYAQVRVAVDGSHYLKGMAMYKDDLPPGVDLMFNTNKKKSEIGDNPLDAMKKMKDDPDNPFGAVVRQLHGEDGKVRSAMNIVNEEGNWEGWSRSLSSQMLSKQSPSLAKQQLDMTFERKKNELDEIVGLTNPVVRRKLLDSYADGADASAVHLKAAALPRQGSHVILPIDSMKETEIYAPNFNNGERVVLVRYPHGGTFEIPELTVNNRQREAKSLLGNARDAVGIHAKVAERLSGADFDGDTVLVIPNNNQRVKTSPPLAKLKGFDPQAEYPAYEGMPKMTPKMKGTQMGLVSNLITDMTIKKASSDELARAVRHSMVVIDAEKHNLNYKQSAIDHGIPQLMKKYQDRSQGGASTLISRATSTKKVDERKPRAAKDGGPIDPATGKLVYTPTGNHWVDARGKVHYKKDNSTKLAETDDAHTLVSSNGGTVIEKVYADHSNRMKALANSARKELVHTPSVKYSPSAKVAYAAEVAQLNSKLALAVRNRPLERQAQVLANAVVKQKRDANPDMDNAELKKLKGQALMEARSRTGAAKEQIVISDTEWDAIQAGAISEKKLTDILNNADLDRVKQLATPKSTVLMTGTKQTRAKSMLASGYTQAEVAEALGVSVSTLKSSLSE